MEKRLLGKTGMTVSVLGFGGSETGYWGTDAATVGIGVIAKRPVANVAWRTGSVAPGGYPQVYWERLQKLAYPLLTEAGGVTDEAIGTALRFTLAQSAVAGSDWVGQR